MFLLASFENKSGCRMLDLLEFVKKIDNCFLTPSQLRRSYQGDLVLGEHDSRVLQWSSLDRTKAQTRILVAPMVR